MNLAEHFESQENRRAFWIKVGLEHFDDQMPGWYSMEGELTTVSSPLSDDVKLEVLVDLWNAKWDGDVTSDSSCNPVAGAVTWEQFFGLSGTELREALVRALLDRKEVEE